MDITDLVYIDSTGYHLSDYPSFQTWLIGIYQGIYGQDVYLENDSQDGQFLAILAQAFYDTGALGQSVYNSFSPVSAQGAGLARNVKINGLTKLVPSFSTVDLTIVGVAGTVIINGIANDSLSQQWLLPASVTIPIGGSIDVTATAGEVGAVDAGEDTITSIFTPTNGWQTVTNALAAVPGAPVESDAALRIRQQASVADPSLTVFEGTVGGVSNLTGVTKVAGYENPTGTTDGNGVPGHSICIVTAGGDSTDIANEIALHKTPGTNTYGGTTVLVYDNNGMPLNISFQMAVTATIGVTVNLSVLDGWSADFEALIQASIAAVINAGKIGNTVLLSRMFAPAYLNGAVQGSTYEINSITLNKNGGSFAASNVALVFDEDPVCDPNVNITIVIS